jgi:hypothetical protein
MTKAYLVKLAGGGDQQWTLLDQEAYDYLSGCCDWRRGDPIPQLPESVINNIMAEYKQTREETITGGLILDPMRGITDNDIALGLNNSLFNGERYEGGASVTELNAFCKKHGLEVEDGYEGYIY